MEESSASLTWLYFLEDYIFRLSNLNFGVSTTASVTQETQPTDNTLAAFGRDLKVYYFCAN